MVYLFHQTIHQSVWQSYVMEHTQNHYWPVPCFWIHAPTSLSQQNQSGWARLPPRSSMIPYKTHWNCLNRLQKTQCNIITQYHHRSKSYANRTTHSNVQTRTADQKKTWKAIDWNGMFPKQPQDKDTPCDKTIAEYLPILSTLQILMNWSSLM